MNLEPIQKLGKDLRAAAKTLSDNEARFLVDYYYIAQEDRKRSTNQVRALNESKEPNAVIDWLADQTSGLENEIKKALDYYTENHPMGRGCVRSMALARSSAQACLLTLTSPRHRPLVISGGTQALTRQANGRKERSAPGTRV